MKPIEPRVCHGHCRRCGKPVTKDWSGLKPEGLKIFMESMTEITGVPMRDWEDFERCWKRTVLCPRCMRKLQEEDPAFQAYMDMAEHG